MLEHITESPSNALDSMFRDVEIPVHQALSKGQECGQTLSKDQTQ